MSKLFKTTSVICLTGSLTENARLAVRKIRDAFTGFHAGLVVYFCSTDYDAAVIATEMHDAFPGIVTMGCTSAGEGIDGKIFNRSVVAMAFSPEVFSFSESVVVMADAEEAKRSNQADVFSDTLEAVRYLGRNLGQELRHIDYREYVGFMLSDCVSDFNENVVERFGDLSDVMLVGGFAGDDLKFNGSGRVMYRGRVYGGGATILALWKPTRGFSLLKTEAVEILPYSAVVTSADEENNIVWKLDGEDADKVYARLMGVPVEGMNILDFGDHPWASMVDGEAYLRGVMEKAGNGGLRFFAKVREGTKLTLTKTTDILTTTRKAMEEKRKELESLSAILHINCASRQNTLNKLGKLDEFAALFGDVPSIAVSSYGEIYIGTIAMTSSMLLFK